MATMQFHYSAGIEPPIQTDSDHVSQIGTVRSGQA